MVSCGVLRGVPCVAVLRHLLNHCSALSFSFCFSASSFLSRASLALREHRSQRCGQTLVSNAKEFGRISHVRHKFARAFILFPLVSEPERRGAMRAKAQRRKTRARAILLSVLAQLLGESLLAFQFLGCEWRSGVTRCGQQAMTATVTIACSGKFTINRLSEC